MTHPQLLIYLGINDYLKAFPLTSLFVCSKPESLKIFHWFINHITPIILPPTEILCPHVPKWLSIVVSTTWRAFGTILNYTCPANMTFSTGETWRRTNCTGNGEWMPPFIDCIGKSSNNCHCLHLLTAQVMAGIHCDCGTLQHHSSLQCLVVPQQIFQHV